MTTKAPSATTGRSLTRGGAVLSSIRSQRTRAHSGTQLTKTAAAEAPDPIDVDVGRRIKLRRNAAGDDEPAPVGHGDAHGDG